MGHPRWPGFNTKTGNPIYDNQSRRMNQRLYRDMKTKFKIRGASRKRKKKLMRVEGAKYIQMWAAMMNDIAAASLLANPVASLCGAEKTE